jgi:hypothetical protein
MSPRGLSYAIIEEMSGFCLDYRALGSFFASSL